MSRYLKDVAAAAAAALLVIGFTSPSRAVDEPITHFDLGIDVTLLPQDKAGAQAYFASQDLETQHVLKAACDTYIKHPIDAEMPQTVKFCQFILGPDRTAPPAILAPFK